ncbi:MAG TPA: hypothetical protein PL037_08725, partial [Elusimicrobiales bacterium]|nr:hypothetical protein [Elusimicrobiales bacterium]
MRKILSRILFILALLPGISRGEDPYIAPPEAGSSRFLLLDRPDPSRISASGDETGGETGPELDPGSGVNYSPEAWNEIRERIETGRFNTDTLRPAQEVQVSTDAPAPPPPEVEFKDSGTSLSVTGRKVIALNYTAKRYLVEQSLTARPRSLSLFEITQQMQVRMQGKVGQKITVN